MSFDELQKKTAIVIALFSITTLVFMLHHTLMKQFAIAEVAYAKEDALSGTSFALTEREVDTRQSPYDLCIPVPEGTHYEDFHIENHYFTKKLVVRIHTGRDDFYRKHVVFCNSSKVKKSFGQKEEKELTLSFSLNQVYDCDADLTDGMISLRFSPVAGSNSHLVLLDPSAKPDTDAQASLLLAQKIVNLSEPGKDSVRFFLTRMGEDAPTDRDKRDGGGSLSVPVGGKGVAECRLAGTSECRITDCGCTKAGGANGSVTEAGGANGSITESGGANGSIAEAGWARRGRLHRAGADALQ